MKLKILELLILFLFSAQLARADGLSLLGFAASAVHAREQHKEHHDFHPLTSIAVIGVGIAAAGVTVECSKPKNRDDDRCAAGRELVGINGHPTDLIYEKSNTLKLRKNLLAAGEPSAKGCAAHHIVAQGKSLGPGGQETTEARNVLKRCDIDINDAINGIFLPQKSNPDCFGVNHNKLHTEKYYRYVAAALELALGNGCDTVKDRLQDIKRQLQNNNTPWEINR